MQLMKGMSMNDNDGFNFSAAFAESGILPPDIRNKPWFRALCNAFRRQSQLKRGAEAHKQSKFDWASFWEKLRLNVAAGYSVEQSPNPQYLTGAYDTGVTFEGALEDSLKSAKGAMVELRGNDAFEDELRPTGTD